MANRASAIFFFCFVSSRSRDFESHDALELSMSAASKCARSLVGDDAAAVAAAAAAVAVAGRFANAHG